MKAYNKAFPGDFFYLHCRLLEKVQDTMTHEQLLQKYNNAKNSAKSA
jgi:F0F1-type ATP synthase alpha subunit